MKHKKKLSSRKVQPAPKRPARHNGRRNPDEIGAAAELSEQFHGRPARRMREIDEPNEQRITLTELGALRALHVQPTEGDNEGDAFELEFRPGVRVCSSPDGRQLYFAEGDQSVDLEELGLAGFSRDHVRLGHCLAIVYRTRKGFDGFEKSDYIHEFGEDNGTPPTLNYDSLNRRLYLSGGTYTVKPEGIVN